MAEIKTFVVRVKRQLRPDEQARWEEFELRWRPSLNIISCLRDIAERPTTLDGREIWLGAATHDTGLDVRPGVASHAIDPDLDAERTKVGADLEVTGLVASAHLVTRPDPLREGLTATGGSSELTSSVASLRANRLSK